MINYKANSKEPAFLALLNGDVSNIENVVATTLPFRDDVARSFDTHGCYNNGDSHFTPTMPGYYLIGTRTHIYNIDAVKPVLIYIYKNGAAVCTSASRSVSMTDGGLDMTVVELLYANGTDWFSSVIYHSNGDNTPDLWAQGSSFWGVRVSP